MSAFFSVYKMGKWDWGVMRAMGMTRTPFDTIA